MSGEGELRAWRREQRAALTATRDRLLPQERLAASAAIDAHLATLLAGTRGGTIGAYWPIRGEYDVRPLLERLRDQGATIALPVVAGKDRPLVFRRWEGNAALVEGVFGLRYPPVDAPVVAPGVLIIPLLGFDAAGYRLGYGAGYYDRTLAALSPRPRAIGVGFACSRIPTIRPQPYDVPMDVVVTEAGVSASRTGS